MSSGDMDMAGLDAAIDKIYSEAPPSSGAYKERAGELRQLFEKRDGNAAVEGAPIGRQPRHDDGNFSAPVEHVEPVEAGSAEAVAAELHEIEGGSEIVHEWGGPESQNFRENVAYLKHAVEHATRADPALLELLNSEVEDEHGNVSRLGDNPALIRAAAEYGRLLANRSGIPIGPSALVSQSLRHEPAPRAPTRWVSSPRRARHRGREGGLMPLALDEAQPAEHTQVDSQRFNFNSLFTTPAGEDLPPDGPASDRLDAALQAREESFRRGDDLNWLLEGSGKAPTRIQRPAAHVGQRPGRLRAGRAFRRCGSLSSVTRPRANRDFEMEIG